MVLGVVLVVLLVAFSLVLVVALPLLLLRHRKLPSGPPKPPPGPPKTKQNEKQNKTKRKTPFSASPDLKQAFKIVIKALKSMQRPVASRLGGLKSISWYSGGASGTFLEGVQPYDPIKSMKN